MRIECLYPVKRFFDQITKYSEEDSKTTTLANELIGSIPTMGIAAETVFVLECASAAVPIIITWLLTKKPSLGHEVHSEPYWLRWWRMNPPKNESLPPIFDTEITKVFDDLKLALKNAKNEGSVLPHAIFMGPFGTGKSTACATIARGAEVNYCIATEENFIEFAQDSERVARFFSNIESSKFPTIIVIEEVQHLLKDEEIIQENPRTHRAFKELKTYTGKKTNKLMFLLNTNERQINPALSSRISYTVHVDFPNPNELKKIIRQQANRFFGPSADKVFDSKMISSLVDESFLSMLGLQKLNIRIQGKLNGKAGRDVEDGFIRLKNRFGKDITKIDRSDIISTLLEKCK